MSPPADAEPVTPDGGVLKTTVAPGAGDPPPLHARCLVHYACYIAATGENVVDTRSDTDAGEPAVLVAGRGTLRCCCCVLVMAAVAVVVVAAACLLLVTHAHQKCTCTLTNTNTNKDASLREVGLQLALARMRRGERAWVYVTDPKYGYGERGSFSFPSVPPGAALAYDATLLEFEPSDDVSGFFLGGECWRGWVCVDGCVYTPSFTPITVPKQKQ
jgi:hypothetical protein